MCIRDSRYPLCQGLTLPEHNFVSVVKLFIANTNWYQQLFKSIHPQTTELSYSFKCNPTILVCKKYLLKFVLRPACKIGSADYFQQSQCNFLKGMLMKKFVYSLAVILPAIMLISSSDALAQRKNTTEKDVVPAYAAEQDYQYDGSNEPMRCV